MPAILSGPLRLPADVGQYLDDAAQQHPDACAVVDSDGSKLTYRELSEAADRIAAFLHQTGVTAGDRVGLFMHKSCRTLAAIFGILRLGAAYVPVDASGSTMRAAVIFRDCDARIILADADTAHPLLQAAPLFKNHLAVLQPHHDPAKRTAGDWPILDMQDGQNACFPRSIPDASRLAYILYTSGSCGMPKGVAINHHNATAFIEWASAAFGVRAEDQLSSYAPFHFDLSVFDIYVSIKNGACLHLINADLAMSPRHLATFLISRKITIWYSTPGILGMLAEYCSHNPSFSHRLRLVLFAGEVFPITKLRMLMRLWPQPAYYNLYGPTETNVCTFYRVRIDGLKNRTQPLPIGHACAHCETVVVDENLHPVPEGKTGLLCVAGPAVFTHYWNDENTTAKYFFYYNGKRWYNTGDRVRASSEGYIFLGRRDRTIKRRGYRIALEEIEHCLTTHPQIRACAVISTQIHAKITVTACLVACNNPVSVADLGKFCRENLTSYMVPDHFRYLPSLPLTSTGKTDYQTLERQYHDE